LNFNSNNLTEYDLAVNKSLSLVNFERMKSIPAHSTFHLERISILLSLLGNPQNKTPIIHIAGTKGKGSVCAMVGAVLIEAGFNVGMTTSPHLHSVTERILVGGIPISKSDFSVLVEQLWPFVEQVEREYSYGSVTWFEFMIAAAFKHFENSAVDFQIIETGLGGRLDATNIVTPNISVITSISLDHQSILGDSIEEITLEKSGIIKQNTPVVVAPQNFNNVIKIIEKYSANINSEIINVEKNYIYGTSDNVPLEDNIKDNHLSQKVFVESNVAEYLFDLPLLGKHQIENAAAAIATIEILNTQDYFITKETIQKGLSNTFWPGRFQFLPLNHSSLLIDGAHNVYSMFCLTREIQNLHKKYDRIIFLFGSLYNHDTLGMLKEIKRLSDEIIIVETRHPKSTDGKVIKDLCETIGMNVLGIESTTLDGMYLTIRLAQNNDLIVATGSLSVVAEVIEMQNQMSPEIYNDS